MDSTKYSGVNSSKKINSFKQIDIWPEAVDDVTTVKANYLSPCWFNFEANGKRRSNI